MSGLLSSCEGHLGILLEAWQDNRNASRCEAGDQGHFLFAQGILTSLPIFKRSQASSPFEALNSAFLSSSQRDVRPAVEMRQGNRALSRVSTGV